MGSLAGSGIRINPHDKSVISNSGELLSISVYRANDSASGLPNG
jgi:hypothetical protein